MTKLKSGAYHVSELSANIRRSIEASAAGFRYETARPIIMAALADAIVAIDRRDPTFSKGLQAVIDGHYQQEAGTNEVSTG